MAKLTSSISRAVVIVVVAAVVVGAGYYFFFRGPSQKTVKAQFVEAVGIYPGTPVKILGVPVGTVSSVKTGPSYVTVTMSYDSKYDLAVQAGAQEVANSLVSDRYIQLAPLASPNAQALASNATIPTSRTSGPEELDDIYAALNKLSVALGPNGANKGGQQSGPLSTLLNVGAANLKGNGTALGTSITKLSQAAQTLANSRGNLFQTVQNLSAFTKTLQDSDGQIKLFESQLATVAGELAGERTDLGAALNTLGTALDEVNGFVKQNAGKFHTDIAGLEDITNILVRQRSSLEETLAVAPVALANLVHSYQPDIGALGTRSNLASLTDGLTLTSLTGALCGIVKDLPLGSVLSGLIPGCKSS